VETGLDPLSRYKAILNGQARPRFQGSKGSSGSDSLQRKVEESRALWSECQLCEHRCRARRDLGQVGQCGVAEDRIASHFIHYGEERPLVPSYTIFFSGCNLRCAYCQNWDISTDPSVGEVLPPKVLARMIEARGLVPPEAATCRGIRNVNWVGGDPIPHLPYVLQVLLELDLDVPQVWNSNMYMTEEALSILEGTMDVYLTDLKYGNDRCAERLSEAPRYWEVITRNHLQAARQGEVIVRHLMLPGHLQCCTLPVLEWLARNMPGAAVNIMDQYRPVHLSYRFPELGRGLRKEEHQQALRHARDLGLTLI
jgi:putative pyruvate formate lyase activating enzyme